MILRNKLAGNIYLWVIFFVDKYNMMSKDCYNIKKMRLAYIAEGTLIWNTVYKLISFMRFSCTLFIVIIIKIINISKKQYIQHIINNYE